MPLRTPLVPASTCPPLCSAVDAYSPPPPRSYYVHGHRQGWHSDAPHGPFAFVLSLTRWEERRFSGGETMLLQPWVLDYWRHFDPAKGTETPQLVRASCCYSAGRRQGGESLPQAASVGLHSANVSSTLLQGSHIPSPFLQPGPAPLLSLLQMTLVPPRFNQLTVFDGRIPHAVQPVRVVPVPCAHAPSSPGPVGHSAGNAWEPVSGWAPVGSLVMRNSPGDSASRCSAAG